MSDDNNVVEFPATSAQPTEETPQAITPEEAQAKAQQGQEFLLKMIEKKRHEGVEILSRKVDNLENNTGAAAEDAGVESRLRDLHKGLGGSLTSLEAINSLLDYFRHDLFQVIKNLTRLEQAQFQTGAHLQTLLRLLEKKEIISEQEMQETWNEMVPQNPGEQASEEATSEPKADPV